MSLSPFSQNSITANQWVASQNAVNTLWAVNTNYSEPWIRNPTWLPITIPAANEQKFVALYAVFPDTNFIAVLFQGAYTINWGDGTIENYNNNVTGYHQYSYSNSALDGTDGPVTFQGAADTVTRNSHGYQNGYQISFYSITNTTGISTSQIYYVVNATNNTFQLANTAGGSPIDLINDGTGTILPYKQTIITVTPQSGQNLFTVNIDVKHNQAGLNNYYFNYLDIAFGSPNLTSISTSNGSYKKPLLERYILTNTGQMTSAAPCGSMHGLRRAEINGNGLNMSLANCFYQCYSLTEPVFNNIPKHTTLYSMFDQCSSLERAPFFDTSLATSASGAFRNCYSLKHIPCYDLSSVTSMEYGFTSNCYQLEYLPPFNLSNLLYAADAMSNMYSLRRIPAFNLSKLINGRNMFGSAFSLVEIPPLDLSSATAINGMFFNCRSVKKAGAVKLNTNAGVSLDISSMFSGCSALLDAPEMDTSKVTNFKDLFSSCFALRNVPKYNTSNGTNFRSMFDQCYSLLKVPAIDTSNGTDFTSFLARNNVSDIPFFDTSKGTTFAYMFYGALRIKFIPKINTSLGTDFTSFLGDSTISNQIFPPIDLSAGTNLTNILSNTYAYTEFLATGARVSLNLQNKCFSSTALTTVFNNLGTVLSVPQTLTISGNYGAPTPVSLSGTTTAGSTTITMANTSGITAGMQVTGIGTPLTTPIAVTFQDSGDTVTLVAHGLSNDDEVSFAAITSTTGIIINKIYYVVNAAADTFQVAATLGGAALPLTTDGSGTLRYCTEVVSVVPNTSITVSRPATSSGTNTLAFQTLRTGTALLKGWTVSQ